MSKGLGASYVDRMKRWHVPRIRDKRLRITTVVDRMSYHDGAFKFKLPRYFKDRLYRKKYPCEAKIWNKKLKIYETKIVQRYKSKNMLSLQIQNEVRSRVLDDYNKRVAEVKLANPSLTDTEVHIEVSRREKIDKESRGNDTYSKLARFYNRNRFQNRNL